jgi:hypothetical protein
VDTWRLVTTIQGGGKKADHCDGALVFSWVADARRGLDPERCEALAFGMAV